MGSPTLIERYREALRLAHLHSDAADRESRRLEALEGDRDYLTDEIRRLRKAVGANREIAEAQWQRVSLLREFSTGEVTP